MKGLVFASKDSYYLGKAIASHIQWEMGSIIESTFQDGEQYLRINIQDRGSLAGKSIIYVSSTHSDALFMNLIRIGHTFASLGTTHRFFCIPYFGYSTMERDVHPGEVVSAKISAHLLSTIPNNGFGNVFFCLDLHISGLLHYFSGDCTRRELYAEKVLLKGIESLSLDMSNVVFGSADLGRPNWVETFARHYGKDMVFIRKKRDMEKVEISSVIGNVVGKKVLIYDDMIRSASTLIQASNAYKQSGALEIYAIVSHFAISSMTVMENLTSSPLNGIVTTNSHPSSMKYVSDFVHVYDVSDIFGNAIMSMLQCGEEM